MKPNECKRFGSCSAPLCPTDENSLACSIWYPDEEICQAQEYCHELWIRNQRKIAKKAHNKYFYFNYQMLSHNCIISKGIEGLDPDRTDITEEQQLKRWLKQHPEKRIKSDEEREKLKNRMVEVRQGLILTKKDANRLENSSFNRQSA